MRGKITITAAAAALLAGTVWVAAQGTRQESPSGSPGAQGPASGGQPSQKSEPKDQKSSPSRAAEPKGDGEQQKAQTNGAPKDAQPKSGLGDPKSEQKAAPREAQPKSDAAQPKAAEPKSEQKAAPKAAEPKSEQKSAPKAAEPKSEPKSQQGAGSQQGSTTTVTTEQRTHIRQTIVKESSAPRVKNVDFSLNVGTVVPRTVTVAVLPSSVVEIYPRWRGYKYFIVEERIVIVEPDSLKIVFVIDA